jgi:hypothetical protein
MTEQQKQLNPESPTDAAQIVEILTREIALPRIQAQALIAAIQTLTLLAEKAAAPVADNKDESHA